MTKLPTGWRRAQIGDICEVVRGASPRPAGDVRFFGGDFLPWITVGEVTGTRGMYLERTATFLTRAGATFTRTIPAGTLILTNSGATLGVPKITTFDAGANDGIAALLNPKAATNEYLYFVLESRTDYFRNHLAPGNGQPNLNTDLIKEEPLYLPPIEEQTRLASLFKLWDIAIERTARLIAVKRLHLSQVRERLLGAIASGHAKLREATRESIARNGSSLARNQIMGVTNDRGMRPMREETIASNIDRYKIVRPGAFAYNPMRLNVGSIAMSPFDRDVLVSPDYVVFECDQSKLLPEYLSHLRLTGHWASFFDVAGSGSVRVRIYYDDLAAFSFPLPSIEEQRRVVELLDTAVAEIDALAKYAGALHRQKRGLMQRLMTGRWRVPLDEGVTT